MSHDLVSQNRGEQVWCRQCRRTWDVDDAPEDDEQCEALVYGQSPAQMSFPSAREIAGLASDPNATFEGKIDVRPGAIYDKAPPYRDARQIGNSLAVDLGAGVVKEYVDVKATSLVEFAEFKGYKLGPWMKQQLQEIDEAAQRGLQNQG